MIYVGIDPGKTGAVAFLPDQGEPWFIKNENNLYDIVDELENLANGNELSAMIEKVHSFPGDGHSGSFKFGQSYGQLEGVLAGLHITLERVIPRVWQQALGCLTKGKKNVTKVRAKELFPNTKITHANADALLIAEYARRLGYLNRGS